MSAAASIAASLLMPNERTTPDFAPNPVMRTVFSCANARRCAVAAAAATAKASFFMRLLLVWTVW